MKVDLVSIISAHSSTAQGIGALWVRRSRACASRPSIDGGGTSAGMRSGTLNVPAIVGFGAAAEIAQREMAERGCAPESFGAAGRDYLFSHLDHLELNRHPESAAGNLNVSFAYVEGEGADDGLKNVAVSWDRLHQRVARALVPCALLAGVSEDWRTPPSGSGSARFNTEAEVDFVGKYVATR